jgi:hypothetical protein
VKRFDCRDWLAHLDAYLDGGLAPERRRAAERHLAACPACQELVVQARTNRAQLASGPDDARLTAAVLERTSGSACRRAEQLLPDRTAGGLTRSDATLLEAHLEHCATCRRLAATLAWLEPLLPELGVVEPDVGFTATVLARTSGRAHRTARIDAALQRTAARIGDGWQRLWQRPRIAFEGAYVAVLLVVGLCALPVSPLRDAPPRALAMVQAGPDYWRAGVTLLAAGADRGAAASSAVWSAATGPDSPVGRMVDDVERRGARVQPAYARLRRHIAGFVREMRSGETAAAARQLWDATRAGTALWQAWWRSGGAETQPPADGDRR